ncbi:hypothetical protein PTI98_005758 [Pleurotus ostreatus]|nr:hypothetical protein PTI98_005758 [Pleurotus ostreatus]
MGRSITIDPANAWNRSIVETSVDLDAIRVTSDDEIDILGSGMKSSGRPLLRNSGNIYRSFCQIHEGSASNSP